jgi:NADH:ubiquinone oxidoreductase subunit 2 (subunit N)
MAKVSGIVALNKMEQKKKINVGYLFIGFSCGTIEGIQSLLIGVFIYILMTINVFAIVLALCQKTVS